MTPKNLFFDMDGTLINSAEGILNSVCHALNKLNLPIPPREQLLHFIGPPLVRTFAEDYQLSHAEALRAVALYREYYTVRGVFECRLYNGIPELLNQAHTDGYRLVLATCKPTVMAEKILRHFELAHLFAMISGPELDGTRNEKHEVIAYAMQRLGIPSPSDVLMIGDRRDDVLGAAHHQIACAGVLWGFGGETELRQAGAASLFATPAELSAHLHNRMFFHEK